MSREINLNIMKNLINLSIIFVLLTVLGGCQKDDDGGQQDSGHAPKSVESRIMNFDDNRVNFHSNTSCSAVITYSYYYSVTSSSCNYKKTSENSATLSLNVAYHFYQMLSTGPFEFDGTYDYQITLFFISPNEGYASGTRNGTAISDVHFTMF